MGVDRICSRRENDSDDVIGKIDDIDLVCWGSVTRNGGNAELKV